MKKLLGSIIISLSIGISLAGTCQFQTDSGGCVSNRCNDTTTCSTNNDCSSLVGTSQGGGTVTSTQCILSPENGVCGSAQGSYLATDTTRRTPFCSIGNPVPSSPIFPSAGSSSSWI